MKTRVNILMLLLTLAVFVALATGCAGLQIDRDNPPPADFPKLRHVMMAGTAGEVCGSGEPACARLYFAAGLCVIHTLDARPSDYLLAHERGHCAGFDHPGESSIRAAFIQWKGKR